jgi:glycosyltransferase involved in cell wall biosynthesis
MRILMLGWEFPPFISGGLGTACFGLTKALVEQGLDITFVLPRAVDDRHTDHLRILGPRPRPRHTSSARAVAPGATSATEPGRFRPVNVPAVRRSSYAHAAPGVSAHGPAVGDEPGIIRFLDSDAAHDPYASDADPLTDAQTYARMVVDRVADQPFDLIHAHDWMTFPAAIALAAVTGKPWVAHLHSTEFDRSGERTDPAIYDLERHGMQEADRVITVSAFTKAVCAERYGINPAKIEVVYNGADGQGRPHPRPAASSDDASATERRERIVLFLGRITAQKGPTHFVAAAKKVLEKLDGVKFVMAGAGDLAREVIEEAARSGLGQHFTFTGFLRGNELDRVFDMADVYVMPSVSEPFGIAPLEAINHHVPVIVSRQSGVSEVLRHALKVDFWNTNDLADKIIAVLRHPPLGAELRANALTEVQDLTWGSAAQRCRGVYDHAIDAHAAVAVA